MAMTNASQAENTAKSNRRSGDEAVSAWRRRKSMKLMKAAKKIGVTVKESDGEAFVSANNRSPNLFL